MTQKVRRDRMTRDEALTLTAEGIKLRMARTGETIVTGVMISEVTAKIAEDDFRYDNYINFVNWGQFRAQLEERLKDGSVNTGLDTGRQTVL